jgi:hypothetical protein
MKIDDIITEWKKDAKINEIDLDESSIAIPVLHAKWLDVLTKERQKLRKLEIKKKQLQKTLFQYFRGELNNPDDLKEIGREPLLSKPLNSDTQMHIDSDNEMVDMLIKISYQQEVVDVLNEILKSINTRNWVIRNAVEYRKHTQT